MARNVDTQFLLYTVVSDRDLARIQNVGNVWFQPCGSWGKDSGGMRSTRSIAYWFSAAAVGRLPCVDNGGVVSGGFGRDSSSMKMQVNRDEHGYPRVTIDSPVDASALAVMDM